ncbi:hypothetical protein ACOI3B_19670, partial [Acinetobacter baumannii]
MFEDLLLPMFDDEYYPDILVAELKQLIEQFAKKVQKPALAEQDIYRYAHQTLCTRQISQNPYPIRILLS